MSYTDTKQILGTKSDTLHFLKPKLTRSIICDLISFTVQEWQNKKGDCLNNIKNKFYGQELIIRSSAVDEDSSASSMAGYYLSIPDIPAFNPAQIESAVDKVIESYKQIRDSRKLDCQVLVQSMVKNVSMSGVIFTKDINTGAPYYIINYDDESGRTDTITGGGKDSPNKTVLIFRNALPFIRSARIKRLMEAIKEIEEITGLGNLDIEFAETHNGEIYIFQVREIPSHTSWIPEITEKIESAVIRVKNLVRSKLKRRHNICGDRPVFGKMPDWNPAEMIGSSPHLLAFSLYKYLITDKTWRIARGRMGYAEPKNTKLMISLYGQPYIDARLSFNNLIPADIDRTLADKIVNAWLDRLAEHPELHDKVEFEVAITAYTFDFGERVNKLMPGILNKKEVSQFKDSLFNITDGFLSDRVAGIPDQVKKINMLDQLEKERLKGSGKSALKTLSRILDDCVRLGTVPFAILARHAFVAKDFLRALEQKGVLNKEDTDALLASVPTIATQLIQDARDVQAGKKSQCDFFSVYGHLRPGTYDIQSLRYDQRPTFISGDSRPLIRHLPDYALPGEKELEIDRLLKSFGFSVDCRQLLSYIKTSIQQREYAKFVFSRSISDALEIIAGWGSEFALSREELSFLDIHEILRLKETSPRKMPVKKLREKIESAMADYEVSHALRLPHLIVNPEDVMVFPLMRCCPNFITRGKAHGPHVFLDGHNPSPPSLSGKIVVVESADPGFDWIFSQNIAGLITKFGGANSHMAIRCAELSLPAAIGCGEQIFDRLLNAGAVELDCKKGNLKPVLELC